MAARRCRALVVVGGMMASGKTTVAARLGRALDARVVSADSVRKAMLEAGRKDAYLPGFSEFVYPELLRRADLELQAGRTVLLDATFRSREVRRAARALARKHGVPFRFVECRADPDLCRERLRQRERKGGGRGWLDMFDGFLELWEPVEELPAQEHRVVDTSQPLEPNLELVIGWLSP